MTKSDEKKKRIAAERKKRHLRLYRRWRILFYGYLISGLDFHSVPEGDPDVVLAVDRDEIDKALELCRVEFRHQVSLLPQGVKELPDR